MGVKKIEQTSYEETRRSFVVHIGEVPCLCLGDKRLHEFNERSHHRCLEYANLGSEVAEHEGFRNSGSIGNFPGGRSAIATLVEESSSGFNKETSRLATTTTTSRRVQ